jgi:hypothetical protein
MAKKVEEDNNNNFTIDTSEIQNLSRMQQPV